MNPKLIKLNSITWKWSTFQQFTVIYEDKGGHIFFTNVLQLLYRCPRIKNVTFTFKRINASECKAESHTTTLVAVRYRYVLKRNSAGVKVLQFLPHKVREVKHDQVEFIDDFEYLRSLDPKDWKHQDHYRVLGIPTLRFNASEETIRSAYRQKVLHHHPDKRKAKGADIKVNDDNFTCITMAYETLGDPKRRKSYDSVDPEFDDGLPSSHEIKKDFYGTCAYYFELNGRWSYKDQENKVALSGREGKRHADKLNKAERARKKKKELAEKDRKLEAEKAKEAVLQKRIEDEQKAAKEAKLAMEKAEAEGKDRIEAGNAEKCVEERA
ncbi:dnaJ homolog subfamily C member 2-like [Coccinella septempunctata]|uniref:dnaJ homolog subfamily C member 2-like n=1 Tax=Coccinella septempunctata TaxID=41139 RepID=UPI001D09804A|nr:dnaJ homolog subfamily C member 2-like [Coccinella septempunctata]